MYKGCEGNIVYTRVLPVLSSWTQSLDLTGPSYISKQSKESLGHITHFYLGSEVIVPTIQFCHSQFPQS